MGEAIAEARTALAENEVPIGCVIVEDATGRIVGRGHNRRESNRDPTAHAEIFAVRQAACELSSWRLIGCTLYVTLEPCPMCAGAIVQARIPRLVYGCADPKAGAVRTLYQLLEDPRLNHRCQVVSGVHEERSSTLLKTFFAALRKPATD